MKNRILILSVLFVLTFQASFAAFPVKHTATVNSSVVNKTETALVSATSHKSQSWFTTHVTNVFRPVIDRLNPVRRKNDTAGLLSMIFGIAGLTFSIYGIFFSIAAIVLGAIGEGRRERFSKAGLIMGIVGAAIDLLVLVLVIALITATL
jgi:hypothetical protein